MLKMKPNCELCDCDLSANSITAMICSYECTFCQSCVDSLLCNVCPNCGGGFVHRPIRPFNAYREGISIKHQAPSHVRVITPYLKGDILDFVEKIKHIAAHLR